MEEQVKTLNEKQPNKKIKIIAAVSTGVAVLAAASAVIFKIIKSKNSVE